MPEPKLCLNCCFIVYFTRACLFSKCIMNFHMNSKSLLLKFCLWKRVCWICNWYLRLFSISVIPNAIHLTWLRGLVAASLSNCTLLSAFISEATGLLRWATWVKAIFHCSQWCMLINLQLHIINAELKCFYNHILMGLLFICGIWLKAKLTFY